MVKAKDGAGSATLSMAYAGYLFTSAMLKALAGQSGVVQCAFVENSLTKVGCRWYLSLSWVWGAQTTPTISFNMTYLNTYMRNSTNTNTHTYTHHTYAHIHTQAPFFAAPVTLGPNGVEKVGCMYLEFLTDPARDCRV